MPERSLEKDEQTLLQNSFTNLLTLQALSCRVAGFQGLYLQTLRGKELYLQTLG